MPKTVVSITPMALEADSRTLKIARSLARSGYRSIVVEGAASRDAAQFGLPVMSLGTRGGAVGEPSPMRRKLREGTGFPAADAALAAAYRARYRWQFGVKLPPADLYYLHAFTYFPAVARATRRHAVPYIYDAHDCYARIHNGTEFSGFQTRWINPFLRRLESECCRGAAAVVTVADGIAELIAEAYSRRPAVIRNAHDLRTDRPPARDIRATLGLGGDATLIVMVGHDKPGVAMEAALEALSGLPPSIHLAFVGSGYARHAPAVAGRGLQDRVHFSGPVAPDAIVPFIGGADAAAILLFAYAENYRLCLPNKFFQAMGAGLPLIYPAGFTELRRICQAEGMGIAVDPLDPASLREAFARVVTDKPAMAKEREAMRRAAERMSWAVEERQLLDLVRSVVERPRQ